MPNNPGDTAKKLVDGAARNPKVNTKPSAPPAPKK
jgi:hypothetical protein